MRPRGGVRAVDPSSRNHVNASSTVLVVLAALSAVGLILVGYQSDSTVNSRLDLREDAGQSDSGGVVASQVGVPMPLTKPSRGLARGADRERDSKVQASGIGGRATVEDRELLQSAPTPSQDGSGFLVLHDCCGETTQLAPGTWSIDGDTLMIFDLQGRLREAGTWNGRSKHGHWDYYSENGSVVLAGTYANGKADGLWRQWHPNGMLACEATTKDGDFHGWCFFWKSDGTADVLKSGQYHMGRRIDQAETPVPLPAELAF